MRIPLHNQASKEKVLDLHMYMNRINPSGFRQPPTSKKNPRTRSKKPVTRIEKMAAELYPK